MTRSSRPEKASSAVLVIDALELRRAGVVSLLKPWADGMGMTIVEAGPGPLPGQAESGKQPYRMILLVIGALGVGDPEPQEWIGSLRQVYADVPLVLVSDREEPRHVVAAFEAGVRGFVPTSIAPPVAIQAFTFILSGGSFFPPSALAQALQGDDPRPMTSTKTFALMATATVHKSRLTARQRDVLERLRQGASNKLIGRQLKLRESTVKVHVRQIMRKFGASNRTQAALCAEHWDSSKIDPDDSTAADQSDANGAAAQKALSGSGPKEGIPQIPSPDLATPTEHFSGDEHTDQCPSN